MALEYLPQVGLFLVGFRGHNFHTRLEDSGTYMNGLKFMFFFCKQMFRSHGAFWVKKGLHTSNEQQNVWEQWPINLPPP